ncbi:MFS transporter [Catenulispora rubra]|uniref:MFS transporter n=1 Tax=Catenulispora rubra TaxID=280293 RepID=UPI0018922217|nr:MFS transporter [Catenulispora rubra]
MSEAVSGTQDVVVPAADAVPVDGASAKEKEKGSSALPKGAWAVMFTVLGASMMDLLDATVMNVAAPSIRNGLGASNTEYQWISTGYVLSFSVLLIAGGRLGDIAGRRRMFLIGLAGFTIMSAVCAVAQNPGELIAARLLQGSASAMMIPQGIGMIREKFGRENSQKAFAIFGPFMGLSAALGPVLGGTLITYASWRWVFVINLPVGVIALYFAAKVLPKVHHSEGERPKLDYIGLVLCSIAVGLLVYPVIQGREHHWDTGIWLMLAGSAVVMVLFAVYARARHKKNLDPFLETSLFRKRAFTTGTMTIFLFFGACAAAFTVSPLLLQVSLGWSPLRAGLTGAWWSLGTIISMGAGQAFVKKTPRRVLHAGLLTLAVGMALSAFIIKHYAGTSFTLNAEHQPIWHSGVTSWNLAPALLVSGIGMGLVFAPFFGLVLAAVDDHELGSANGVISSFNQLGNAVAAALFSTLFFNRVESGGSPFPAAELVYWLAAGILVLTWLLAFMVPKTARSEDEIMV